MNLKLIVWLWNPELKHKNNRHNIGFFILDKIIEQYSLDNLKFEKKINWFVWKWEIDWNKIIFLRPITYMNLSWNAVYNTANFYKIKNKDILIIQDDIDLELWKIKLKNNGHHGWQNWIKHIIEKLWTKEFYRLKIWIWRPDKREDIVNYVLSNFKKSELEIIDSKYDLIIEKLNYFLQN